MTKTPKSWSWQIYSHQHKSYLKEVKNKHEKKKKNDFSILTFLEPTLKKTNFTKKIIPFPLVSSLFVLHGEAPLGRSVDLRVCREHDARSYGPARSASTLRSKATQRKRPRSLGKTLENVPVCEDGLCSAKKMGVLTVLVWWLGVRLLKEFSETVLDFLFLKRFLKRKEIWVHEGLPIWSTL